MGAQDPCKIVKILGSHISMETFDDNVDGDEWYELSLVLLNSAFHTECFA
jgi:hypothetical protein